MKRASESYTNYQNHPESRHRPSVRKRRANGERVADRQPMNSTELLGYTYAATETPMVTCRISEIRCSLPTVREEVEVRSEKPMVQADDNIRMTRDMLNIVANALEEQKRFAGGICKETVKAAFNEGIKKCSELQDKIR